MLVILFPTDRYLPIRVEENNHKVHIQIIYCPPGQELNLCAAIYGLFQIHAWCLANQNIKLWLAVPMQLK